MYKKKQSPSETVSNCSSLIIIIILANIFRLKNEISLLDIYLLHWPPLSTSGCILSDRSRWSKRSRWTSHSSSLPTSSLSILLCSSPHSAKQSHSSGKLPQHMFMFIIFLTIFFSPDHVELGSNVGHVDCHAHAGSRHAAGGCKSYSLSFKCCY
jgi:hypothetical protein